MTPTEIQHALGGFPILTLVTFIPLAGAIVLLFMNSRSTGLIKGFAFVVTLIDLAFSLPLYTRFDRTTHLMQFVERHEWIPSLGAQYYLGIDGISVLLILLTTLLGAVSVLCSFKAIEERQKEYYVSLLVLQTGMLGVFIALDFFLFYIFWEVMLVPMYFLIGIWGGPRKLYAAIKFFLYTLAGSVFLLLGILALYFIHGGQTGDYTFDIVKLIYQVKLTTGQQFWIFLAFFVGFAIKVPMFPFHTWLPDAHVEAPTAGSVILAGVLLKMGTYGFVRFNLPLFPQASQSFVPFIALLSIIGIIYGALVAMAQDDIKKLVAYSSVSHLGFVMLGVFALNVQGVSGGMLQMINHGLSTGALFLIVGIIYERRHTRMIADFGGLSKVIPVFTVIFAITMLSSIGLPGLNGFVGEFLILVGAFQRSIMYAAFAVVGIILGAAYMLWLFQRMMFGPVEKAENQNLRDCTAREVIYMLPLLLFMFVIGIYPKPYLSILEPSVANIVRQVQVDKTPQASSQKSAAHDMPQRAVSQAAESQGAQSQAAAEGSAPGTPGAGDGAQGGASAPATGAAAVAAAVPALPAAAGVPQRAPQRQAGW